MRRFALVLAVLTLTVSLIAAATSFSAQSTRGSSYPSATATRTRTPTKTPTRTPTRTPTKTPTKTPSPTRTPTRTPSPTNTPTPTVVPTDTPTVTPTYTPDPLNPTATPTITPNISNGCQTINEFGGGIVTQVNFPNYTFYAREQIVYDVRQWIGEEQTSARLDINGVTVAEGPVPTTLTYTIPADGVYTVYMQISPADPEDVLTTCIPDFSSPAPTREDGR